MISIEQSIWQHAQLSPDKIAVKSGKSSVSYAELCSRIIAARDFLMTSEAFGKGEVIILAANKQIEFVYIYFGAHLAGLKVVPIDAETNATRFHYIAEITKPIYVIGFDKMETTLSKMSMKSFSAMETDSDWKDVVFPAMNEVADILFTTGTTGNPKGVPLTFENEAAAALNINTYIGNNQNDVELLALPVSHSFGLGRLRCCLSNGQTIILLGSFVNTKRLFRTMQEESVTGFTMVPSSWKFLQKMTGDQLGQYSKQLKYIEMGSAFFSKDDKRYLADLLPETKVTMHYGLTEASRSAFMEFHEDALHLESVGKASPNTQINIFDEEGNVVPQGLEGEICVKGLHTTSGYLNDSVENIYYGDYFRTGDWGAIDGEGYIYLKSRKKELINVGGKKVSPIEVEEQILKLEGISDCACIGVPDPDGVLGEVVKAFIVAENQHLASMEFITHSLNGRLESYKIPYIFEYIDEIPKTQNGKVLRNLLQ